MNTTIATSGLTAVINAKGGELISLKSNKTNREYIWEGNPDFWGKHAPVLFPIVGTLKDGSYTYNGERYALPRHGFARDKNFELIDKSESQAVFILKADEATLAIYPFRFELQISYQLTEDTLLVSYKITNKGEVRLPFSIGAHPAFALPEVFDDYSLQFEHGEDLLSYRLQCDLLSDETIEIRMENNRMPLGYPIFAEDALIFKEMKSKCITILERNNPLLDFRFNDFPNFGIWTKQNAPFVCLEPWLGYSDTLKASGNILEKEAISFVPPDQNADYQFSIEIL